MKSAEVKDWKPVLAEIKNSLAWGDQRRIAVRLGCGPNKVNLALQGFCGDEDFLSKLVAESKRLLKIRAKYAL